MATSKLQALVICVATVIVICVIIELHVLWRFDNARFLRSVQGNSSNGLLLSPQRIIRNVWGKNAFCNHFVLNTYNSDPPMVLCEQVKCHVNRYSKQVAMCSYEGLAMRPWQMKSVVPTDSDWIEPSNGTINLLQLDNDSRVTYAESVLNDMIQRTNPKNFEVRLTRYLAKSEKLRPAVCNSWINRTTFLHVSNGVHIYFRFMDLYNVHKALSDYNETQDGFVLRIGYANNNNYLFPEFDRALFPGAVSLNDFQGNGTLCFRKVILVSRSYQSIPFQCKMNSTLRRHCFECDGKDLNGSPLSSFRERVLKACNITKDSSVNTESSHKLVIISRQPYERWHGDNSANFKRVLHDEALVVARIQEAFPDVGIEVVRMEELDICEQVRYAVKADVLLGVHGAGLVHFWWLRDGATGFELEPTFQTSNPSFRMLAKLTGRNYASELIRGVATEVSADINQLISSLEKYL